MGLSVTRLLAVPVPRVLLPGGRVEIRLDRAMWRGPLRNASAPALAAFYHPGSASTWPEVGTMAGIVGRRSHHDQLYLRLRGLRRIRAASVPAGPAVEVDVEIGAVHEGSGELDAAVIELQRLVRRYHAALVEHGERADIAVSLPPAPEAAAYRVASLLRVSEPERQFLLEAETTHDRLGRAMAALRRETELLRRTMGPKGA